MTDAVTLKSLRMENFGCFIDRTVEFDRGINQLVGPNESGKSTVITAILTAIFEDGTTRKKDIARLKNWNQNNPYKLTLIFVVGDKEFTLIRDHGTGRDLMTDSDDITYEGKAIREKLATYFGTPDRSLFESVFCFRSDDSASLEKQKNRLKSSLETPIFSGFDRVKADTYLDEEIKKIDNPRAHGPRELDVLDERIQNLLQHKNELDGRLEILEKDQQELDQVLASIKEFETDIDRLESETAGGEAYLELNNRMIALEERLQAHLNNYSKAQQDSDDLKRIERELSEIILPRNSEIEYLELERDELNEDVGKAKKHMDDLIEQRSRANRDFLYVTMLLVFLIMVYIINVTGVYSTGLIHQFIIYTIPMMTLVWAGGLISYLSYCKKKKKATVIFRSKLAELDYFYADLNDRFNLRAADAIKGIYNQIARRENLLIHAENLQGRIELLTDGNGLEHLARIGREMEQEVAEINREFAPLREFSSAASRLQDLKQELTAKRVRHNAYREQAASLGERCTALEPVRDEARKTEKELEAIKRQHREITERLEVLRITRAALNRAADRLIEQTFSSYSELASIYLSEMTGGLHRELRFSEENDNFELKTGLREVWRQLGDFLSSSARDAVYMSLHVAAMNRVSPDFAPPVMYDQPEAYLDSERRKYFREMITRLASERQVIYSAIDAVQFDGSLHIIKPEQETEAPTEKV